MGLGTGRRGMKSPPLLIAVLLACVFVLGINYWITSSRCVELQTRVTELEGRVRRAAAERGAVEMKKNEYEDMLAKQKKQIDTIQSLHSSQLEHVHSQCNSEKEILLNNMTNKDYIIQSLQVQISHLQKHLEDSKLGLKELQESQTKKLSYELAQCSSKIAEMKEQCEERLRKADAKDGNAMKEDVVITEAEKQKPTTKQDINLMNSPQDDEIAKDKAISDQKSKSTPLAKDEEKEALSPAEVKATNNLQQNVEVKKPSAFPQNRKEEDDDQAPGSPINPDNVNVPEEEDDEPKVEDAEDTEPNKDNQDVERDNLLSVEGQQEENNDIKPIEQGGNARNPNDYNGDDANVAESEADKQAQLADNKQNLKDEVKNGLNGRAGNEDVEETDDQK